MVTLLSPRGAYGWNWQYLQVSDLSEINFSCLALVITGRYTCKIYEMFNAGTLWDTSVKNQFQEARSLETDIKYLAGS